MWFGCDQVRRIRQVNSDLAGLLDEWASSLFRELDYQREARNGGRFRELYGEMQACVIGRACASKASVPLYALGALGDMQGTPCYVHVQLDWTGVFCCHSRCAHAAAGRVRAQNGGRAHD